MGETVVEDQVEGAADVVELEVGEAGGLVGDPLGGETAVAVEEDGEGTGAVGVGLVVVLSGTDVARDEGAYALGVGGVGEEGETDAVTVKGGTFEAVALVGEDVAGLGAVGGAVFVIVQLLQYKPHVGAQYVGEHVEPPPVGAANHNLPHPTRGGVAHQQFHYRNQYLYTGNPIPCRVRKLRKQRALKRERTHKIMQTRLSLRHRRGLRCRNTLPHPPCPTRIHNMGKLIAYLLTVRFVELLHNRTQGHFLIRGVYPPKSGDYPHMELTAQITLLKPKVLQLELMGPGRVPISHGGQRVHIRDAVSTDLIGTYHPGHLEVIHDVLARG